MTRFTVRVVLHDNASLDDYLLLDQRLQQYNLSDTIQAATGAWFRLPPGEYHGYGDITGQEVREQVSAIASTIRARHQVFVTEGHMRYWVGLPQVAGPDH